ncbi:MAG: type II toxin-antitoxin system HicA family toxin [Candidatus Humimicrobiaceae bacterium]
MKFSSYYIRTIDIEELIRTTVPYHAGKILHSKTLKSILRDIGLTMDEFRELMK